MKDECKNLDKAFFNWLYDRAQLYLKYSEGQIDFGDDLFEFEGYEYTQKALIQLMIYKLSVIKNLSAYDSEHIRLGNSIIEIWKILWPYMWW